MSGVSNYLEPEVRRFKHSATTRSESFQNKYELYVVYNLITLPFI